MYGGFSSYNFYISQFSDRFDRNLAGYNPTKNTISFQSYFAYSSKNIGKIENLISHSSCKIQFSTILMSCEISKKLTENGENDEKPFFDRFFPTKLSFYKNLPMKTVFYAMETMYL